MKKLDESKVKWIILQKQKGTTTSKIAEIMNASTRWVKKLWSRYKYTDPDKIVYHAPMGRPESNLPGRREHSAVLTARTEDYLGAVRLHGIIRDSTGINIPYNNIHKILRDTNLASEHPKKSRRHKWVHALSIPIRTPCDTPITSCSTTADGSCAIVTSESLCNFQKHRKRL